jgi:hypothetical protein
MYSKIMILCSLMASILFLLPHRNTQAESLKLNINLSDSTYYVCQSIWLDVELINTGEDSVRVRGLLFPGDWQFHIVVTDGIGDTLRLVLHKEFGEGRGIILKPGEVYYKCFDLTEAYANYDQYLTSSFSEFARSLAPGDYKVSAWYRHGGEKLITSELPFSVVEPAGKEKQALSLFAEAYRDFDRKDYDSQRQKLECLIDDFSTSRYVERAIFRLFKYDQLLKKHPDSGYTLNALIHATADMDNMKKKQFLQTIAEKYTGSRAARLAETFILGLQ